MLWRQYFPAVMAMGMANMFGDDDEDGGVVVTGTKHKPMVTLQFSDGPYTLNRAMVDHLGGADEVLKYEEAAKHITADEFLKKFWGLVSADAINKAAAVIVAQHLANPLHTRELNLEEDITFINPFGGLGY